MTATPRSILDLLFRRGVVLWLLAAVLIGMDTSQAQDPVHGSGDFILNHGPVVSDTGTWIGSTESHVDISISRPPLFPYMGTRIPARHDGLPHSINASAVNGTVTKSPNQAVYDFNTPVILSATPDPGFIFEKWTLDTEKMNSTGGNSGGFIYADLRGPYIWLGAMYNYEMVAHFIPATRVISVGAVDLAWEQQAVGATSGGKFKITNSGNAPLTVASIDYPAGFSGSWEGSIAPGSSQEITVNFAPTAAGTFSGMISVNSDATAGTFTLPIMANAQNAYSLTGTSSFADLQTSPTTRTYWQGSIVTLQAMPVKGYVFQNWTEDEEILSKKAIFDLTILQEHQVWANYLPISRKLEVTIRGVSKSNKSSRAVRGVISVKNSGTAPVYLYNLYIQGNGTGPIVVDLARYIWIQPGSTVKSKVYFTPQRASWRLQAQANAEDLTSPVKKAEWKSSPVGR